MGDFIGRREYTESDVAVPTAITTTASAVDLPPDTEPEYYTASYPYQSQEPGDLTFNAGDVIAVYKKDGDWWTGKLNDVTGIFPSNYVSKIEVSRLLKLNSNGCVCDCLCAVH